MNESRWRQRFEDSGNKRLVPFDDNAGSAVDGSASKVSRRDVSAKRTERGIDGRGIGFQSSQKGSSGMGKARYETPNSK